MLISDNPLKMLMVLIGIRCWDETEPFISINTHENHPTPYEHNETELHLTSSETEQNNQTNSDHVDCDNNKDSIYRQFISFVIEFSELLIRRTHAFNNLSISDSIKFSLNHEKKKNKMTEAEKNSSYTHDNLNFMAFISFLEENINSFANDDTSSSVNIINPMLYFIDRLCVLDSEFLGILFPGLLGEKLNLEKIRTKLTTIMKSSMFYSEFKYENRTTILRHYVLNLLKLGISYVQSIEKALPKKTKKALNITKESFRSNNFYRFDSESDNLNHFHRSTDLSIENSTEPPKIKLAHNNNLRRNKPLSKIKSNRDRERALIQSSDHIELTGTRDYPPAMSDGRPRTYNIDHFYQTNNIYNIRNYYSPNTNNDAEEIRRPRINHASAEDSLHESKNLKNARRTQNTNPQHFQERSPSTNFSYPARTDRSEPQRKPSDQETNKRSNSRYKISSTEKEPEIFEQDPKPGFTTKIAENIKSERFSRGENGKINSSDSKSSLENESEHKNAEILFTNKLSYEEILFDPDYYTPSETRISPSSPEEIKFDFSPTNLKNYHTTNMEDKIPTKFSFPTEKSRKKDEPPTVKILLTTNQEEETILDLSIKNKVRLEDEQLDKNKKPTSTSLSSDNKEAIAQTYKSCEKKEEAETNSDFLSRFQIPEMATYAVIIAFLISLSAVFIYFLKKSDEPVLAHC